MSRENVDVSPQPLPTTFWGYLRSMGPGIIVVLTWLGAGDVVECGVAGGNYGYALMWVLVVAVVMRFLFVSMIAKYQLCNQHGEGVLDGLMALHRAGSVMAQPGHPDYPGEAAIDAALAEGLAIGRKATLADAMPMFDRAAGHFLVITDRPAAGGPPQVVGVLFELEALRAYTRAMAATAAEEHS